MYNFSTEIPDHIAKSFSDKCKTASLLGINNIETGDVFDAVPLIDMNGEELEEIRNTLIDEGKRIVLLSTSLGTDEHEKLNLLFRNAHILNVKGIKIDPTERCDTIYLKKLSASYGIPLFVENKTHSDIENEKQMHEVIKLGNAIGLIFNPFEFVCLDRHPFFHIYYSSKIKNYIKFLRINDGLFTTHKPTMLSYGCAEVKELASIMLSRSFDGYFSFAPYIKDMTLEQYKQNLEQFKHLLKNM